MRKAVAVIFLAFAAALLASACGDGGEPAATPEPTATTAGIEGATPEPEAPATGRIAFQSDRDGNFDVYVMNADGSGLSRITDNPALDANPAWSPVP